MQNLIKKCIRTFILFITLYTILPIQTISAQDDTPEVNWFEILPKLDEEDIEIVDSKIEEIWQTWWKVRETYNETASWLTTSQQIASWIMNRNTITDYIVFIVKFLSQLWLAVWMIFIMYAWYNYMLSVFKGWQVPKSSIKNAIIWIFVVIFSYAIMRIFTSIVWLT